MAILVTEQLMKKLGFPAELTIAKNGVPGVMSADPRLVPNAHLVREISFSELGRLRSEVVHPALLPYVRGPMRINVRNIQDLSQPGTVVTHDDKKIPDNLCKAISVLDPFTLIDVRSMRMVGAKGYLQEIFRGTADLEFEMLASTSDSIRFTVKGSPRAVRTLQERLEKMGEVTVKENMAQVVIVGREMEKLRIGDITNVVENVLGESEDKRIPSPDMIEYDPSRPNYFSVAVPHDKARSLVQALHDRFIKSTAGQSEENGGKFFHKM